MFIHDDGLARFATEKYKLASAHGGLNKKQFVHLTNTAINKRNGSANEGGYKRSLQTVWDHLTSQDVDVPALKAEIQDMIIKTIITIQP